MLVKITFTEPLLGTISGNKEVAEEFIVTKHLVQHPRTAEQQQEELDAIPTEEALEKATTLFARTGDDKPMLWDYQVKGYFKEACLALIEDETYTKEELKTAHLSLWTYKRILDHQLFIYPRRIPLNLSGELLFTERPLRGETARGPRIALARSETAPPGTIVEMEVRWRNDKLRKFIIDWLDFGKDFGMGQWRNSGCGRFTWEDLTPEIKA